MEQEQIKELKMMDSSKWEVARIFHFTYPMLARPCQATLVYFRPISDGVNVNTLDELDKKIFKALQGKYKDLTFLSQNLLFEGQKEAIKQKYDGGRKRIEMEMNVWPDIQLEQVNLSGIFSLYRVYFKIFLNTTEVEMCVADCFDITYSLLEEEKIKQFLSHIKTLA